MDNKIKSIRDKNISKTHEHKSAHFKTTIRKKTLIPLSVFLLLFLLILVSPYMFGKHYSVQTIHFNEPEGFSNSMSMSVNNAVYNPDKQFMKITIALDSNSEESTLNNVNESFTANYISDRHDTKAKVKTVKVSDDYIVLYYYNLPKDYGAVSVQMTPNYIYKELVTTNDLKDRFIKFYIVDNDIKHSNSVRIEDKKSLEIESLKFKLRKFDQKIDRQNKSIAGLNKSNDLLQDEIKKKKSDMKLQTISEQDETQTDINSTENTIAENKSKVKKSKDIIKELKNKRELLVKNIAQTKE